MAGSNRLTASEMKNYILSIDNGTQSVRALLFDLDGELIAKGKVEIEDMDTALGCWSNIIQ